MYLHSFDTLRRFVLQCVELSFAILAICFTLVTIAMVCKIRPWHFKLTLIIMSAAVQFYVHNAAGLLVFIRLLMMPDDKGEQLLSSNHSSHSGCSNCSNCSLLQFLLQLR